MWGDVYVYVKGCIVGVNRIKMDIFQLDSTSMLQNLTQSYKKELLTLHSLGLQNHFNDFFNLFFMYRF